MNKIAIIDIGSNSVRLIIVQVQSSQNFNIIYELKESVRLGKDMGENNRLDKTRMKKAVDTISSFKTICGAMNVDKIIAVATEAVRRASNQREFLDSILFRTGVAVRVLSGSEEAYYDYMGVINSMDIADCLLMDIGGSSTEFILVKDHEIVDSKSLPYGSISLTDIFHSNSGEFKNLMESLLNSIPWIYQSEGLPIIGIGGTFRNLGKINRKSKDYPVDTAYNYKLENIDVENILFSTIDKLSGKIKKIKGLSSDRSDIFIGPIYAIFCIIHLCKTREVIISGSGVREGLLFEHILGLEKKVSDVLDYSLKNMMLNYDVNQTHAYKVYALTNSLYSQLNHLCVPDPNAGKIIKTAALLHDAGIKINFYDHHKHAFYLILNSRINGLSHKELLMSAYTAALHRKDEFKIDLIGYRTLINQRDALLIQQLGILLKIAEKLDTKLDGNVQKVNCSFHGDSVILKLTAINSANQEIEGALSCKDTFKRLFGKKLVIG